MKHTIGRPIMRSVYTAIFVLCLLAACSAVAQSSAPDPTRMMVCEATDQSCLQLDPNYASAWSFDGTTGVVTSPASESATRLTIETLSQDKIVIRRLDGSGRSATYSGAI